MLRFLKSSSQEVLEYCSSRLRRDVRFEHPAVTVDLLDSLTDFLDFGDDFGIKFVAFRM